MTLTKTKNIFIIYNNQDWGRAVPFRKKTSRDYFEKWYITAQNHNFHMYRASIKWFDFSHGHFSKCWTFTPEKGWIKITKSIKPDVIIDFTPSAKNYMLHHTKDALQKYAPIINNHIFRTTFDSKVSQQLFFSHFLPKGVVAIDSQNITEKLQPISTQKIVVKESFGVGGESVHIIDKKNIHQKSQTFSYPVVLQECVDISHKIPGCTQHKSAVDLRIIYINHKPVFALSRIAQKDSLFTNFNKGAHAEKIPLSKIPQSIWHMSESIQKTLTAFNNVYYALDFIFDKNDTPYFMEINTTPGFALVKILSTEKECSHFFDTFFNKLLKNE